MRTTPAGRERAPARRENHSKEGNSSSSKLQDIYQLIAINTGNCGLATLQQQSCYNVLQQSFSAMLICHNHDAFAMSCAGGMQRMVHLFGIRRQFCVWDGDDHNLLRSHPGRHHNPLHQRITSMHYCASMHYSA